MRSSLRRPSSNEFDRERATQVLIDAIRKLASARTVPAIADVVRQAARLLVEADGATLVLREEEACFYLDEDAIAPLWKGQRFPLTACISGWSMIHQEQVVIEDIYTDPRVPHDAYRPTFVKSLVMTPVRRDPALASIGIYWQERRLASAVECSFLQDLADATAVALESADMFAQLEAKVEQRTQELTEVNRELEAFSYTVAHDLRTPLTGILGFSELLETLYGAKLDTPARDMLREIGMCGRRMNGLITDLLNFARCKGTSLMLTPVDLSTMARDVCARLAREHIQRRVDVTIEPGMTVLADERMMSVVLENLFNNAFKYSRKRAVAEISFGRSQHDGKSVLFVRDNGAGFDASASKDLFTPFKRLHSAADFEGTGVGLATVARIIRRHGGELWADSKPDQGATFSFTIPQPD